MRITIVARLLVCNWIVVTGVAVHARIIIDGGTASSSPSRVVEASSSSSPRAIVDDGGAPKDVATGGIVGAARRLRQAVPPSAASASEEQRLVEVGAHVSSHARAHCYILFNFAVGLVMILFYRRLEKKRRALRSDVHPGLEVVKRAASVPSTCVPDATVIIVVGAVQAEVT
jgi:hypothetical protein